MFPPFTTSSGSQLGLILPSRGHLAMTGDIFGRQNWGRGMLLASSKQRPGMLQNILTHTGQPFTAKNYPTHNLDIEEDVFKG